MQPFCPELDIFNMHPRPKDCYITTSQMSCHGLGGERLHQLRPQLFPKWASSSPWLGGWRYHETDESELCCAGIIAKQPPWSQAAAVLGCINGTAHLPHEYFPPPQQCFPISPPPFFPLQSLEAEPGNALQGQEILWIFVLSINIFSKKNSDHFLA